MPADSRSENGVASLAYVAGIHVSAALRPKTWIAGTSPAMTGLYAEKPPTAHPPVGDFRLGNRMKLP